MRAPTFNHVVVAPENAREHEVEDEHVQELLGQTGLASCLRLWPSAFLARLGVCVCKGMPVRA